MRLLSVAIIALLTPSEASFTHEPKQISADDIGDGPPALTQAPEAEMPEESEEMANIKEKVKKEAKEANEKSAKTIKANAYSKKMQKYYNNFDGTFHMPDGTRQFTDETIVDGVNSYH